MIWSSRMIQRYGSALMLPVGFALGSLAGTLHDDGLNAGGALLGAVLTSVAFWLLVRNHG